MLPLTHRESFLRKVGLPSHTELSLEDIAHYSKFPIQALLEVANKGLGAYHSNLSSVRLKGSYTKNPNTGLYPASKRLSPIQWAYARVYAFVDKAPTVFYKADRHIAVKYGLLKQ